ncbi:diguanylate cyclase [Octadecabacter sp. 1_MG-2023]|uniref:sensor domain-containing diguanylate cyclase n=1 Tax=unclassified Octadecabacter TaxID=196158 RepID=UPI002091D602|nr:MULTISPECIES: diguanylate cyclase [unclassified Octadecabacter]MDO6733055.1 diguanylate cyclase [Octadecabacter sp. 1_MG-2023]
MTKSDKIENGAPVDAGANAAPATWRDARTRDDSMSVTQQIMNAMEQGILVWSASGVCELFNTRVFDVLELEPSALGLGTSRDEFLAKARARGEMSAEKHAETDLRFNRREPFQFDRNLPSGRVVATYARPTREGGFVVTFTDVSVARQNEAKLAEAKHAAEQAEAKAKQILQEERARRAEARALADLDEWLQSCKSLTELYLIVEKFLSGLIPGSKGELYIYSNSRDVLDGVCEWGDTKGINDHITADECWALRRGRGFQFKPETLCLPCDHLHGDMADAPGNYSCVPVVAHGDTVGMLHVEFDPKSSYDELKAMTRFASRSAEHISMAIANVKLRDELHAQSIRDPLTGLYNRRYFMDAMRRETSMSDRGGQGYGLISLDADKFKTFNDNHGHEAGDAVLRALGEQMIASLPENSVCARVGGEEFAVLLPKLNLEQSMERAESLREAVAALEVHSSFGVLPKVTISSGVAAYLGDNTPPNLLMKRADEALYAAKADGRNCVKPATAGQPTS